MKSRQRGRGTDLKDNGWGGERKSNLRSSVLDAKRNLQVKLRVNVMQGNVLGCSSVLDAKRNLQVKLRVNVMQGNVLGCFSVLDAMRDLESQSAGKCDAMHCVDSAMT